RVAARQAFGPHRSDGTWLTSSERRQEQRASTNRRPPGPAWGCDLSRSWLLAFPVREKKFAAQSPELVASHGDQDDDDDNGKDGVGVAASFGDPDQSAQAVFGQQNDLR